MHLHLFGFALLSATVTVASIQAHASGTLTRTFVSSTGVDTNPCTIAQPCATFAAAYSAVQANGIVAALDPGKYGPLSITMPVTINGNGWAAITGTAGINGMIGAGISINVGAGAVVLTGLEIDGAGASNNGIYLNSTLSGNSLALNIIDCRIYNFINSGIAIQPAGSGDLNLFVANTFSLNNGQDGIEVAPGSSVAVTGIISGSTAANNNNGFDIEGASYITIATSVATNNSNSGIYDKLAANIAASLTLRETIAKQNKTNDLDTEGNGLTFLYHDLIGYLYDNSSNFTGALYSDGTNQIQTYCCIAPTVGGTL